MRSRFPVRDWAPRPLGVVLALSLATALAAGCSRNEPPPTRALAPVRTVDAKTGTSPSPRLYADHRPIPKGGGFYKVGAPYRISGRWYVPQEDPSYDRTGIASWYGDDFHGRKTANGEIYDMRGLSAAHPTLPMPSYVWVTNESNGRTLLVRVNDRGPYAHDRVIDLSRVTARALGSEGKGLARVRVRYAGPAPLNGDDRREQAFLRNQPWYNQVIAQAPPPSARKAPYARPYAEAQVQSGSQGGWRPTGSRSFAAPMLLGGKLAASRSTETTGTRYLVAGVFRSEANAGRRLAELEMHARMRIVTLSTLNGTLYSVRSEALNEAGAWQLKERLAAAGISDTRIISASN